jgi:hypothetical protein
MRITFCIAVVILALSALPVYADLEENRYLSWILGTDPIYCAFIENDRQFCTWHEASALHLVCELDAKGRLIGEPCIRQDDNTSMHVFPSDNKTGRPDRISPGKRRRMCEASLSTLNAAQSIRQVSEYVGAGPKSCHIDGDTTTCTWHAVRRTPGYIALARIVKTKSKKIDLICEFSENGKSRGDGSCRVGIAFQTSLSNGPLPRCN